MNRWGDGPDTPAGVRGRLSDRGGPGDALLTRVSDETIELAILATRALYRTWHDVPAGGTLRLSWPLQRPTFLHSDPRRASGWGPG